jgi:hypothetical protein
VAAIGRLVDDIRATGLDVDYRVEGVQVVVLAYESGLVRPGD